VIDLGLSLFNACFLSPPTAGDHEASTSEMAKDWATHIVESVQVRVELVRQRAAWTRAVLGM